MRIGIDARFYNESGVGRYLRNLIYNLKALDKKNEYVIFLLPEDYKKFEASGNFQVVCADFKWYGFAEQFKFPKLLNKYRLDLVHFPHFNVPIFYAGDFVVTIHDLIHQHFQMKRVTRLNPLFYIFKHFGYKRVFKNAITKSKKTLVPSNYVSDLLVREWKVSEKKITVTPEAVDNNISLIAGKINKNRIEQIIKKFNIRSPYIFYVGNAHPHKNVEKLIKVFREIKGRYRYLQLVLAGPDHFFWQRIKNEYQYPDIKFIGKVSDEQLVALYKNAQVFVMPSFEEGFGIPLLEAMAFGCPVVSSDAGSLKEVGGDAALYFDPYDQGSMVSQVSQVLNSERIRKELVAKGKIRVKEFSWEKLARQTMEVYSQCG